MQNPFDEFDEPSPSRIAPPIATAVSNPFDEFDEPPQPSGLFRRAVADTGVSLAKGVVGLGEAAVGLLDIPTLGHAGKALEDHAGYDPRRTQEFLEGLYSPEQQAANRAVGEAEGVGGTLSALAENPSVIPHKLVETLPLLGGGGAVARALPGGMSALARGAAGEGTLAAGSSAEHVRQASETGTLSPEQTALAATSGAVTGLITRGSGALANRLGIGDVEQLLAGGGPAGATGKGRVRRGVEGAVTEGLLEEAPQSAQEQALQNLALDKPVLEGVPEAGTLGGVIGSVLGGGVAALPGAPPLADPSSTILPERGNGARGRTTGRGRSAAHPHRTLPLRKGRAASSSPPSEGSWRGSRRRLGRSRPRAATPHEGHRGARGVDRGGRGRRSGVVQDLGDVDASPGSGRVAGAGKGIDATQPEVARKAIATGGPGGGACPGRHRGGAGAHGRARGARTARAGRSARGRVGCRDIWRARLAVGDGSAGAGGGGRGPCR